MKHPCLTSTIVLTLLSASPAYSNWRPLEDRLMHHVFSERSLLQAPGQLQIKARQVRNVTILDLTGSITNGKSSETLRAAVTDLTRKGRKQILLNLAAVTVIDSAGLGVMVSCYTTARRADGNVKLERLTESLKDLLAITKLLTVFDSYDTEAEALNSFEDSPAEPAAARTKATTPAPTAKTEKTACPTDPNSDPEIRAKIREIIADELGVDVKKLTPEARFINDLGADSLDLVELIMRFEEEFGIEIPDEDAEKLQRVADVYCYVEHAKAAKLK